jgi:flavodoxin
MKKILLLTLTLFCMQATAQNQAKKILIAYYSWGGNTAAVAKQIQTLTGGDIFEIQPVTPYSKDYTACLELARKEIQSGYQPEIVATVKDIDKYDIVFVGSPNWCSTIAPPVATFLSKHDLAGKTVVPFCSHGNGGVARCFSDMAKLAPQAKFLEGFDVYASNARSSQSEIEKWLQKIKIKK